MKVKLGKINLGGASGFVNNSFWGLLSTLFQTLFLSIFFVIISRYYPIADFSNFLIANTIYQLIVGFSSMGLGFWFIREYGSQDGDKKALTYRFIKLQTILGIMFYFINVVLAFCIYPNEQIRILTIILGTNIIFDNIIYSLKNLNIAQFQQRKTAIIMAVDGLLRLMVGCILFIYPISLIVLCLLMVTIRLVTVNVFLHIGSAGDIKLGQLLNFKVTMADFKNNVLSNWKFILIVGSAIIFWRSATIIISKFLSPADVANYEISYKIFSIFTLMSIVASTTIYPKFVKFIALKDLESVRKFYNIVSVGYAIFVALSFAFIQSFSGTIIPLIFGHKYTLASGCMKQMFLTLLVFPTVFLQANLLVAMKKEKVDMILNFVALALNLSGSLIGLYFIKSLAVINYSIFGAFLVFHITQNVLLIKLKISTVKNALVFYISMLLLVFMYKFSLTQLNPTWVFVCFLLIIVAPLTYFFMGRIKAHFSGKIEIGEVPATSETLI